MTAYTTYRYYRTSDWRFSSRAAATPERLSRTLR
ncbi:hypothetical protein PKB_0663 [Pseudomonas knackmussii B13]|uniref:Uncharacterized protein n=1 Tax=Pseudomonas knackmussii (strain DSM 6978 / CCUG 54928 / LMG 23759 / B13) TaxID=1301098 RepID=A0A024HAZ5_PSEKB|nr:hypothetical protein PKB_0663 [Pseudomonas knackmussii B13]